MFEKIDKRTLETLLIVSLIVIMGLFILFDFSSRIKKLEQENKIQRGLLKIYEQKVKALQE